MGKTAEQIPELRQRLAPPRRGPATMLTGKLPKAVIADWIDAELACGRLRARRYQPREAGTAPRPILLDFHGGGFVIGGAELKDWFNANLAVRLDAIVVSVEYRLAPEHPFPAAYDDALDAMRWAASNAAEWGGDSSRIVVMGDSAGANLAAGVALAAAEGVVPRPCAQVLLYPPVDLVGSYPSAEEHANGLMQTIDEHNAFLAHYLGDRDRTDPRISPLLAADHRGLPPTIIIAAEHDLLRDQSPAYEEVLRAADVPVRLTTYAGAAHGFLSVPGLFPTALHALTEVADALRQALATTSEPASGRVGDNAGFPDSVQR